MLHTWHKEMFEKKSDACLRRRDVTWALEGIGNDTASAIVA